MKFLNFIVTIFPFKTQSSRLLFKCCLCNIISIYFYCQGTFDVTCKVIARLDAVGRKFYDVNIFHIVKAFKMKNPLNIKIVIVFIVAGLGGGGSHNCRMSLASTQECMEAG